RAQRRAARSLHRSRGLRCLGRALPRAPAARKLGRCRAGLANESGQPQVRAPEPFGRSCDPRGAGRQLLGSAPAARGAGTTFRRTARARGLCRIPARMGSNDRGVLFIMSDYKVKKTDAEWRAQLDPTQYQVTRHAATERPFSGKYWNHDADGVYRCVACGEPLFDSQTKFDAGCGWPSYFQPIDEASIERDTDRSHG